MTETTTGGEDHLKRSLVLQYISLIVASRSYFCLQLGWSLSKARVSLIHQM